MGTASDDDRHYNRAVRFLDLAPRQLNLALRLLKLPLAEPYLLLRLTERAASEVQ
jgi:hypothetical protein